MDDAASAWHQRPAGPGPLGLDARIAANVRALRTQRRWRQLDLAVAAGWSHAAVVALEAGQLRLTVSDAVALCTALQVPLAVLVEGAEEGAVLGLAPWGTRASAGPRAAGRPQDDARSA